MERQWDSEINISIMADLSLKGEAGRQSWGMKYKEVKKNEKNIFRWVCDRGQGKYIKMLDSRSWVIQSESTAYVLLAPKCKRLNYHEELSE